MASLAPSSQAVQLALELDSLSTRLTALERSRTLAHASIDGTSLPVYDRDGTLQMTVGLLPDGTFGPKYYNPNPPPMPAAPTITPTWGGLLIAHYGTTDGGGEWPMDVSRIEIHLSSLETFLPSPATLVGTFENVQGGGLYAALGLDQGVTYWVRLVAFNTSEKQSAATVAVSGVPDAVVTQETIDRIDADLLQLANDVANAATGGVFYNNLTAGDLPPDPGAHPETAVWFRPDDGYSINRWDAIEGAWVPALLDSEAIAVGAVTASKIEAGAVTADKIQVGAITTEKLSVGSVGDNLILNGNFKDLDAVTGLPAGWFADATAGTIGSIVAVYDRYLTVAAAASPTGAVWQHTDVGRIPATVGDQFHANVGAASLGANGTYQLVMRCYDRSGVLVGTVSSASLATANSYTKRPSELRSSAVLAVAAATTSYVRFGIAPLTGNASYRFDNYIVGKVSVSARIADGAITAPKVFAKAITSEKIDTNAVRATHVEAGAITADKIHLGAKGFGVNDNSNFEQEATDASGNLLGRPAGWTLPSLSGSETLSIEKVAPLSGTASARVNVPTQTSALLGTDTASLIPVSPAEKWFVSARVKAVGGDNVAFAPLHLTCHSAVPGHDPYAQFNGSNSSEQYGPMDAISNGQDKTITATFVIPAGHAKMAVSVRLPARTAAGYYLVEDFVAHPAVDNTMVTDISAGKLTTGFIQAGQKILAGVSETGARIEMNANGLYAYNSSNNATFVLNGSNGSITLTGSVLTGGSITGGTISGNTITGGTISGTTITGTTLTTPVEGTGRHSAVVSYGSYVYGGALNEWGQTTDSGSMQFFGEHGGSNGWLGGVRSWGYQPGQYTELIMYPTQNLADFRSNGAIGNSWLRAGQISTLTPPNAGNPAANTYINSGGMICKTTSSRRYKTNIADLPHDVETLLALRPIEYDTLIESIDPVRRFAGFIAEEAHDLGLSKWVEYNDVGEPESFAYAAWTAALQKIVQHQQDAIKSLTDRIATLENGAHP